MFDRLMKPKFYKKCKSAIRANKVRLETIKKKRNVVEKYLKKDIAELLRNGLDYNAYGRAEGLLVEQNRSACYNFIEQFSECISKHVSIMQKQSECPEECKEAIPSLIYAAARFSDLPELRDLRTLFTQRYGDSLESFLNQVFVQKLRAEPPTKDTKLQLMHDIAKEFSIEWDSKALEQKLFRPPQPVQNEAQNTSLNEADDDGHKVYRTKKDTLHKSNDHGNDNGLSNTNDHRVPKINETDLDSRRRKGEFDTGGKYKLHSDGEVIDQDTPKTTTSNTSDEGVSEEGVENVKPFYYRFISPPYVRQPVKSSVEEPTTTADEKIDNEKSIKSNDPEGESRPKPRSVRRRPLKSPPAGSEGLSNSENDGVAAKNISPILGKKDEEEASESVSKYKGNLPLPPGRQKAEYTIEEGSSFRSKNSNPISPLGSKSPTEKQSNRASPLQQDMFDGHVHPKLPEYDDLATRLAALRRG